MSATTNETNPIDVHLGEILGIDWDSEVMAYEEPHIFRSASMLVADEEPVDAKH